MVVSNAHSTSDLRTEPCIAYESAGDDHDLSELQSNVAWFLSEEDKRAHAPEGDESGKLKVQNHTKSVHPLTMIKAEEGDDEEDDEENRYIILGYCSPAVDAETTDTNVYTMSNIPHEYVFWVGDLQDKRIYFAVRSWWISGKGTDKNWLLLSPKQSVIISIRRYIKRISEGSDAQLTLKEMVIRLRAAMARKVDSICNTSKALKDVRPPLPSVFMHAVTKVTLQWSDFSPEFVKTWNTSKPKSKPKPKSKSKPKPKPETESCAIVEGLTSANKFVEGAAVVEVLCKDTSTKNAFSVVRTLKEDCEGATTSSKKSKRKRKRDEETPFSEIKSRVAALVALPQCAAIGARKLSAVQKKKYTQEKKELAEDDDPDEDDAKTAHRCAVRSKIVGGGGYKLPMEAWACHMALEAETDPTLGKMYEEWDRAAAGGSNPVFMPLRGEYNDLEEGDAAAFPSYVGYTVFGRRVIKYYAELQKRAHTDVLACIDKTETQYADMYNKKLTAEMEMNAMTIAHAKELSSLKNDLEAARAQVEQCKKDAEAAASTKRKRAPFSSSGKKKPQQRGATTTTADSFKELAGKFDVPMTRKGKEEMPEESVVSEEDPVPKSQKKKKKTIAW